MATDLMKNGEVGNGMNVGKQYDPALIEQVIMKNDLAQMNPEQRLQYVKALCDMLGLNIYSKPFGYIAFQGQLKLYALKDCTDQLRKIHGVSIMDVTSTITGDVMIFTAKAQDRSGRYDTDIGVVSLKKKDNSLYSGEDLANQIMKGSTKSKRRVTLSICGLGVLDESEVDTLGPVKVYDYDKPIPAESKEVKPETKTPEKNPDIIPEKTPEKVEEKKMPEAIENPIAEMKCLFREYGFTRQDYEDYCKQYYSGKDVTKEMAILFNKALKSGELSKPYIAETIQWYREAKEKGSSLNLSPNNEGK